MIRLLILVLFTQIFSSCGVNMVLRQWAHDIAGTSEASLVRIVYPPANFEAIRHLHLTGSCDTNQGTVKISGEIIGGEKTVSCFEGAFSADIEMTGFDGTKNIKAEQGPANADTRDFIKDATGPHLAFISVPSPMVDVANATLSLEHSDDLVDLTFNDDLVNIDANVGCGDHCELDMDVSLVLNQTTNIKFIGRDRLGNQTTIETTVTRVPATAVVRLNPTGTPIIEGQSRDIQIILSNPLLHDVTVPFSTGGSVDPSEISDPAALLPTGQISISAGSTMGTITVVTTDTPVYEGQRDFFLRLENTPALTASLSIGTPDTHTITINDNEVPPPPTADLYFQFSHQSVNENAGVVTVVGHLSQNPFPAPVVIDTEFVQGAGDAIEGVDFSLIAANADGRLVFPVGQTTASLSIQIVDDADHEAVENINLHFTTPLPAGITAIAPDTHLIEINESDAPVIPPTRYAYFTNNNFVANEEDEAVFTFVGEVSLPNFTGVTLKIPTTITGGTLGVDYELVSGSSMIDIPPFGGTTNSFQIRVLDDALIEGTEVLQVEIMDGLDWDPGVPDHIRTLTISDDELFVPHCNDIQLDTYLDQDVAGMLDCTDPNPTDSPIFEILDPFPADGTFSNPNPSANFIYTPEPATAGTFTFSYRARYGTDPWSNTATITVFVSDSQFYPGVSLDDVITLDGAYPHALEVKDFQGDGLADFVVQGTVYWNDTAPTLDFSPTVLPHYEANGPSINIGGMDFNGSRMVRAFDHDNDGQANDLIIGHEFHDMPLGIAEKRMHKYQYVAPRGFNYAATYFRDISADVGPGQLAAVMINLFAVDPIDPQFVLGLFTPWQGKAVYPANIPLNNSEMNKIPWDSNGDGTLNEWLSAYDNSSSGDWNDRGPYVYVTTADLDNAPDGVREPLWGAGYGGGTVGLGLSSELGSDPEDVLYNTQCIESADIDNDGTPDVVATSILGANRSYHNTLGDASTFVGKFIGHDINDALWGTTACRLADIDNDGDLDFIAMSRHLVTGFTSLRVFCNREIPNTSCMNRVFSF